MAIDRDSSYNPLYHNKVQIHLVYPGVNHTYIFMSSIIRNDSNLQSNLLGSLLCSNVMIQHTKVSLERSKCINEMFTKSECFIVVNDSIGV